MTERIRGQKIKGGLFDVPGRGRIRFINALAEFPDKWDECRIDRNQIPDYTPDQAIEAIRKITETEKPIDIHKPEAREFIARSQVITLVPPELINRITTAVIRRLFNLKVPDIPSMANVTDEIIRTHFRGPIYTAHTSALRTLAQEELRQKARS